MISGGGYSNITQLMQQEHAATVNAALTQELGVLGLDMAKIQQSVNLQAGLGPIQSGRIGQSSMPGAVPSPDQYIHDGGVTVGLTNIGGSGSPAFPPGTFKSAGGYVIAPGVGGAGFTVYKPGTTSPSDGAAIFNMSGNSQIGNTANTNMFSITKNGDFTLPDGTRIVATSAAQTGAVANQSFDIINGNSHVTATWNATNNNYDVTPDLNNGISWDAQHLASTNWSHQTYALALTADAQPSFYEFVGGTDVGKITGATQDSNSTSTVTVDSSNRGFAVATQMQPQLGTPAYGNMMLMENLSKLADNPATPQGIPTNVIDLMEAQFSTDEAATQQGLGTQAGQTLTASHYMNPYMGGICANTQAGLLGNLNAASQSVSAYNSQLMPTNNLLTAGMRF